MHDVFLGQSSRKFLVPGRGPDRLNRWEVVESRLLTCSHLWSHICWYNTIGFVLPCGCSWITFFKNRHCQFSIKTLLSTPQGEFFVWIPNQKPRGRRPPLKYIPQNWSWVLWGSWFGNHPTNPNILGIPTMSIPRGGVTLQHNWIIEK